MYKMSYRKGMKSVDLRTWYTHKNVFIKVCGNSVVWSKFGSNEGIRIMQVCLLCGNKSDKCVCDSCRSHVNMEELCIDLCRYYPGNDK